MINMREMIITQDIARQMLEKNTNNRPLSTHWVTELAERMKRGDWAFNGDTIRMNGEKLLDGQHRLHAVVVSGVPIMALVVNGLDDDVFKTIDDGRRRSASDTLAVLGEKNTKKLASALSFVDCYYKKSFTNKKFGANSRTEALLNKYPGMRDTVNSLNSHKIKLAPPSVVYAAHYIFREKSHSEADEFMSAFLDGASLDSDDPVFLLRSRLIDNLSSKAKLKREYILALFIKAWNYRRSGKRLKLLKYRTDGDMPEQFPVAV